MPFLTHLDTPDPAPLIPRHKDNDPRSSQTNETSQEADFPAITRRYNTTLQVQNTSISNFQVTNFDKHQYNTYSGDIYWVIQTSSCLQLGERLELGIFGPSSLLWIIDYVQNFYFNRRRRNDPTPSATDVYRSTNENKTSTNRRATNTRQSRQAHTRSETTHVDFTRTFHNKRVPSFYFLSSFIGVFLSLYFTSL
jgi:hypothetical protein